MCSGNRIPSVGRCSRTGLTGSVLGLLSLVVMAACGNGGGGGTGSVAASVSATIKVGTAPNAVAVDSSSNKIYVTDFGSRPAGTRCSQSGADLETIDGVTQSTSSGGFGSPFPANPYSVALNPATHTLYVAYEEYWSGIKGNSGCFPFEGFISGHLIGQFPSRVDVNSTTGTIYVTGGDSVGVWDSNWNRVTTITVGSTAVGIAVNATSNKIYVANSGSNNISVIDGTSNSVVATIADPNAAAPVAVAVNPTTNTIYVANLHSDNVTVIDGATGSVIETIPVGTSPSGVAVDSQTNFTYVANAGNSQTSDSGNVTVIDGATNVTTTLADSNAKNPVAVAVNPTTNRIYVANSGSNNVTVIDGAHD